MARPREFCEVTALDRITHVFWQKGFSATTIADLVEASGLQKQSLYNAFGDKEQLFSRAVENYKSKAAELFRPLMQDSAGLDDIRENILSNLKFQLENECRGCMVSGAALDQQVTDPQIRELAKATAKQNRKLIASVLTRAQARGEVQAGLDPHRLADVIFALMNGLSVLSGTGATMEQVTEALDLSLDGMRAASPPSPPRQAAVLG